MSTRNPWLLASFVAVALVGSCAAPSEKARTRTNDADQNHPITVEPSFRSLKLAYNGSLSSEESEKLSGFVADYLAHGNGAISISAPDGPDAARTITALGEQLAAMGVPRGRILVGTEDRAASGNLVDIGYITYAAHTDPCGDWSVDAADSSDNLPMPNFGCAVQQNIAAQIADPRDLTDPRVLGASDAPRRMSVLSKYEQAQTTSAEKTRDQSAAVSSVGNQQ